MPKYKCNVSWFSKTCWILENRGNWTALRVNEPELSVAIVLIAALKKPALPATTPGNVSNWNASSSWGSGGSGGEGRDDDDGGWSQGPPASGSGWTSKYTTGKYN